MNLSKEEKREGKTWSNPFEEKCQCGSVQFSYNGKCLACGLTKEERNLYKLTDN